MYFISRVVNNKYGIVDTKDWVEEVYNEEELAKFKLLGLDIKTESIQKDILSFMWNYWATSGDCSGSGMDMVDSYLVGSCSLSDVDGGSSFRDIVKGLKRDYDDLKSKGVKLDVSRFGRDDKLYHWVCKCLEEDRWNRPTTSYVRKIVNEFHFQEKYIRKALYLTS